MIQHNIVIKRFNINNLLADHLYANLSFIIILTGKMLFQKQLSHYITRTLQLLSTPFRISNISY
ncbi:Uncharacterised protein [Mycobacterium tuberculosis]|nr:Uncharacterised protein [Mycobacterium tuberculosis]